MDKETGTQTQEETKQLCESSRFLLHYDLQAGVAMKHFQHFGSGLADMYHEKSIRC